MPSALLMTSLPHLHPHCLTRILTPSLTPSLPHSRPHCLTHTLTTSLTLSLPHSHPHYLAHALTTSLTPSLPRSHPHYLTHTLTTSLTPSLPHSRPHCLTHTLTPSLMPIAHRITAAVRCLQMLVPTDRRVLEEVCQLTQVGVVCEQSALMLLVNCQCKYPSLQDSTEDLSVSHDVIQRLFDPAKNSPMQLLYTFEVLSGQILPVHEVDSRETSAQDFRQQFLRAGGLKFVINILQRNALPQDVDINIRQDCYAIALFLARYGWVQAEQEYISLPPYLPFLPTLPSSLPPYLPFLPTSLPPLSPYLTFLPTSLPHLPPYLPFLPTSPFSLPPLLPTSPSSLPPLLPTSPSSLLLLPPYLSFRPTSPSPYLPFLPPSPYSPLPPLPPSLPPQVPLMQ